MNKNIIIKNLIKIANKVDEFGLYNEANTLTKLAEDLNESFDKDYDDENDFPDFFDDTFDGEISRLNPDKGFGVADLGEESRPLVFDYDPKKEYEVIDSDEPKYLQVGDIIKIHPMGMSGGPTAIAIMKKTSDIFMPFDPYNSGSGTQSFMSSERTLE